MSNDVCASGAVFKSRSLTPAFSNMNDEGARHEVRQSVYRLAAGLQTSSRKLIPGRRRSGPL
ncbi:hypothetical protein SSBR45G_73270 [Bradyrhizobium sp. SSBR45G]|nr:hypothetical protein SSBR45G_73270 [Bradyrhizobium sp. SSBR45G]GLH89851.1 hypothetical protein SSBR45R_73120 [Bradyrhizobium sp. SSBR45R]